MAPVSRFQSIRWWLILILSLELVIRLFIYKNPPTEYHPGWGFVPQANTQAVHGLEGFGVSDYLSNGEIATPYQDGVSIVVLGDSTTRAIQVSSSENFVSLTESGLRQRGIRADLHNLGKADRSVADYVYLAPFVIREYQPEIVILQVNPASFQLALRDNRENYFVTTATGGLRLVHTEVSPSFSLEFANLISHSGLLSLFEYRLRTSLTRAAHARAGEIETAGGVTAEDELSNDAASQMTLREYGEWLYPQIQAIKTAYPDSRIVFLIIPYTPSFSESRDGEVAWISGVDNSLARVLEAMDGSSVVYTLEAFEVLYKTRHLLPRGTFNSQFNFGHLNPAGHQAVAGYLISFLEGVLK